MFFPAFFGLMLGDVGYGLALAVLALVLRARSARGSTLREVSTVGLACASSAIAFGVVFGEFFGSLGHVVGLHPFFDREKATMPFLGFTVALGAVHVLLGLVLAVVSAWRRGHPPEAMGRGVAFSMLAFTIIALLAAVEVGEVFGNMGTIFRTSTGGSTTEAWERVKSGLEDELLCVTAFIDREKGWAVGIKGTIIHSGDGGRTWTAQSSGTEKNLFSVSFVDAQNGWAVGEYGTILHTGDGGAIWQSQSKGIDKELNGVCFVDLLNGWVVGEFGTILHTRDGGTEWEKQTREAIQTEDDMFSNDWRPMPALYAVHFLIANDGLITGMDGIILKTGDGGKEWRKLQSNCDVPLYGIEMVGDRGWIVGSTGYYLHSDDKGETWEVKDGLIKTWIWLRDVSLSLRRQVARPGQCAPVC